jgi:hypothetical protein
LIHEGDPLKQQESDEQAILAFSEMTRNAASVARKQARAEESASSEQKRLALRRGSSVGKKMNAALSSLAPGSAAAAATAEPVRVSAVGALSAYEPSKAKSDTSAPPSSADASFFAVAAGSRSSATRTDDRMQGTAIFPGRNVEQNSKVAGRPRTSVLSTSPIHASVVCPEAAALRNKKRSLEGTLKSIMMNRLSTKQTKRKGTRLVPGESTVSLASPNALFDEADSEHLQLAVDGPGEAVQLPRRRRTHWDTVLEEMAWLANDFNEERKWKIAAASRMGKSLLDRRLEVSLKSAVKDDASSSNEIIEASILDLPPTKQTR